MDDSSLDDLQAALQAAQEQKSTVRLSERNIVELVLKLQQLGLLEEELLHTVNGREYLTPSQLRKEVKSAIMSAGGRIALVDLPPALNMDLVHCMHVAEALVAESGDILSMVNGELVSEEYFDSLAAEVAELLQELGAISFGDLARQFALSTEQVTNAITSRMGSIIQGTLEAGVLYTTAYLARTKGQLRGALRAAIEPVAVPSLAKDLRIASLASGGSLLGGMVEELAVEGAICGTLRGGGLWLPSVYQRAQLAAVDSFYNTNGFIEYSAVARLGVGEPRDYLLQRFPDGTPLDGAYVAPTALQQLDSAVEEAVGEGGWADATTALPPIVRAGDVAALLARCPAVQAASKAGGGVYASTCFVSGAFIDTLRKQLLNHAREAAQEAVSKRYTAPAAATAADQGKHAAMVAVADVDESEWERGGKKGKKGKAKKAAPKKAAPQKQQSIRGDGGDAGQDQSVAVLNLQSIARHILQWHPYLEDAGEDGQLVAVLAEQLRGAVVQEYQSAMQAVFTAGAEQRRRRCDLAAKAADEAFQRYQLYAHGLELAAGDEACATALARHLIRSAGVEAVHWILRYMEVSIADDLGSSSGDEWEEGARAQLAPQQRSALIKALPADMAPAAAALDKSLNGTDVQVLLAALEEAATSAGLQLRRVDKKGERTLVHAHRKRLSEELAAEEDPAAALALAVPLMVVQVSGRAVSVPGRSIAPLLALLRPQLDEGVYDAVAGYHALVVEHLKAQSQEGETRDEVVVRLQELLPALKAALRVGGRTETATMQQNSSCRDIQCGDLV